MQPKKNHYIASLDYNTCFQMQEHGIKRTFRGKRGGKYRPQAWDQNKGVHNELLKPLPNHNITYWKGKKTHKILADKHTIFHKQIGHVSAPYGINKHRYWLHHRDLDQQHNRSRFNDITSQTSWIHYHLTGMYK